MTLAFAQLPCPDSPLRRLDPRWKLAALLGAMVAVLLLRTLPTVASALLGAGVLALLARLPRRWYWLRLSALALVLVPFALPLPFLLPEPAGGVPLLQIGGLTLSHNGLHAALLLVGKSVALLTLALVLLATAPLDATLKAAHALHVPGVLIQLCLLTYRYIFVFVGELSRLRLALRLRGYRNRMSGHCYRTIGHVTGTLLVRSHERGERVAQAMRCRGFTGTFHSLTDFRTRPRDVVFALVVVTTAMALVGWDLSQR